MLDGEFPGGVNGEEPISGSGVAHAWRVANFWPES